MLSHEAVDPVGKRSTPRPAASQPSPDSHRARRKNPRRGTPWADDREIVGHILAGSREHFDLLYNAYFPRVYRFALKRLRDPAEAEDVAQEVFITIFRGLHSWQGNSSLLVWIFGITRNKVNRRFRGLRPQLTSIDDEATSLAMPQSPVDRTVDARRVLEHCERVIACELTPLQRRIFHLKHLRRQSIRSIAGSLGKSEDAVKANLYRMRKALAAATPGLDQLLQH